MDSLEVAGVRTVELSIPLDVLSDLLSRFIINVPETAKQNLIRICFQIELAYWYYLDFYVNTVKKMRSCGFKDFAAQVFQLLPFLRSHADNLDTILEEWRFYKQSVPTYGAILLSEGNTHVLLVQSYWAKSSWGFPKGKVNEAEDPANCAIREVYEETGFDIRSHIDPDNYFESVINEQLVRLYVITGISLDTKFQPRTRYEIKACEWFAITDLPNNKKDNTPRMKIGVNPNSFFMVLPFVKRLKNLSSAAASTAATVQSCGKPKRRRHKSSSLSENECGSGTTATTTTTTTNTGKAIKSRVYQRSFSEVKFNGNDARVLDVTMNGSHAHNNNNNGANNSVNKAEKKHSKRQLFKDEQEEFEFSAPSWLNFKFDKAAILECIS